MRFEVFTAVPIDKYNLQVVADAYEDTGALRWCKPLECSYSRGFDARQTGFSTGFSTETVSISLAPHGMMP